MQFSPRLSPDPALSPVQVEVLGDATQAISPRGVGSSYPGPLAEPGADPHSLEADVAGDTRHRQLTAVKLAPPANAAKTRLRLPASREFCSSMPATFQLPLILASSLLMCT